MILKNRERLPVLLELLIVTQQRSQGLTHMPFDVIRQHAEENMGADPLFLVMVHRPYQDIDPLQGAKEPCHQGQIFIPAHGILSGQALGRLAGPDDVDPSNAASRWMDSGRRA